LLADRDECNSSVAHPDLTRPDSKRDVQFAQTSVQIALHTRPPS
jgi:hypothetical protein